MRTGKPKEWDEEEKALPPLLPEVSMKIVKAWVHTQGTKKKNIATWRWRNEENNQNYHCQLYMVLRKLSFFVKITLLSSWMATKMTEQEARVFNSLLLKTWSWWSTGLHHQNLFYRRQPSHDPSKCFKKPKARRKATIIVQEIHDTLLKIVLTKTTLLPY